MPNEFRIFLIRLLLPKGQNPMTALSDAVAAAQAALATVDTAVTALQASVAADTTVTDLQADAASATSNIATLTTGLTNVAAELNALAAPKPVA